MLPLFTPEQCQVRLFSSHTAATGAVIRRDAPDIDCYYWGRAAFLEEMRRLGFPVVESAGQMVIHCNREPIRRLA